MALSYNAKLAMLLGSATYYLKPPRMQKALGEAGLFEIIKLHCGSYEMMGIRIARAIEHAHGIGGEK